MQVKNNETYKQIALSQLSAEELNLDVRESDNRYWTKTSSNYDIYACVFYVDGSGSIDDVNDVFANGLRPVIQLDAKLLKQSNDIEKLDINTDEMTINGYEIIQEQMFEVANKVNELIDEINNLKENDIKYEKC